MAVKLICLLCYQCVGGLLHELSNQGAQLQMNVFLEEKLLPQMVACSQVVNGSYYCCGVDDVVSFIETSLCSAFYSGCKRDTACICCWPLCCCMPCCWPPAMQQSIDIAYPRGTQQQTNRTRLQRSIDGTLCEWCQCFSGIWQTVTDEVSQKLPLLLQTIPLKQHTHTHPFNGALSETTWVSRYQKGKTSLDFTEARDSEWQWHLLGHMQVSTLLQSENHASIPPLSFLQARCPSCRPTNSVKALKASTT